MSACLSANYTQALDYYTAGKYKKAIAMIKASKKQYSDPQLHLLWGKSAQKLGQINAAMSAYERVLLLDENNIQAQTQLNRIYTQTHRDTLIKKKHQQTLYSRGGKPALTERGITSFSAKASLAFGYDNNLDATPDSETLQEYFGATVKTNRVSSSFFRFTSSIHLIDDFNTKDGWYAKYLLRTYIQSHFHASFYNLRASSFESGVGYATQNYNIYMPLGYHRIHYLGKDLLSQYRFNPQIFVPIGDNIIFDMNLLYSKNNYFNQKDRIKNDTTYAVEAGGYYTFDKNHISTHFKYEHHSAINGFASKYIGADFWTFKLGTKYYFNPLFLGTLNYRFRYGRYDDTVGTTMTTRDDNFHQIGTKLSYLWSKKSQLYVEDTYSENHSNFPVAVYKKNSLLFGINFTY